MSDELPEGWSQAHLSQLAEARMGKTILAKELTPSGVPVYSAGRENVPWGHVATSDLTFDERTVVLSARGSIGFPRLPRQVPFVSTQTTIAMTAPTRGLAEWLRYWLETVDWTHETSGASIPMVTVRQLGAFTVPVAPEAEQRRIVAKVEALLEQVRRAKDRLDRVPLILKRFRQAVLAAACSGRLATSWRNGQGPEHAEVGCGEVPSGWRVMPLGETSILINGDRSKNYPSKKDRVPHGVPFINAGHLVEGAVDFTAMDFITQERSDLLKSGKVQEGDILYCVRGSLGKSAVVRGFSEGAIASSLLIIRTRGDLVLPDYVHAVLSSPFGESQIREYDNGSAQPNLAAGDVAKFLVPVPPLGEQVEIMRKVNALFAFATAIRRQVEQATARTEKLPQAILSKAFAGQLVPTEADLALAEGRAYECADQLLERVRAAPIVEKKGTRMRRHKGSGSRTSSTV